jgi:PepSY-associated TM region
MRKWHRWLSCIFGAFLLWISVTGVLSQVPLWGEMLGGEHEEHEGKSAEAESGPPGFVCPENMMCRPKKKPSGGLNIGLIHHLHSGETFGPLGTIIATLSGLAMVFFSFSGLWMYIEMFRRRGKAEKKGLFWD